MKKTFFTADHHFGHGNIIQYEQRPFRNVATMNLALIQYWNNIVKQNDIVFHLGDFGFLNKEKTTKYVKMLNGKINLILGNHDNHNIKWYYDCGFNKVYDKPIIYNEFIILSHKPLYTNNILPFVNIHGHIHSKVIEGGKNINVSVEQNDYKPFTWKQIQQKIKEL